jgi:hypothetical protein
LHSFVSTTSLHVLRTTGRILEAVREAACNNNMPVDAITPVSVLDLTYRGWLCPVLPILTTPAAIAVQTSRH